MKAVFIGFGSIAKRHLANLRAVKPDVQVLALRQKADPVPGVDIVTSDWSELLAFGPDIAFVTSPSSCHVAQALTLINSGVDTLIEKPLSDSLGEVAQLEKAHAASSAILMLAYQFRFYSPFLHIRELLSAKTLGRIQSIRIETGMYLPDWRPHLDYRDSVSAQRALGGGVLLELSHELDYLAWLFGSPKRVCALVSRQSDLELDVEDSAEALLEMRSGAFASLHIDMVQRVPHRTIRVCGSEGSLEWNWATHTVRHWTVESQEWQEKVFSETARNTMYENQLEHFLACVENRNTPTVGLSDGVAALNLVSAFARSSEQGEWVAL